MNTQLQRHSVSFPEHDASLEAQILHRERFDAVFGGWSSFHDQYLTALRVACDADVPVAEADFVLTQGYVQREDGSYAPRDWYRVTLRFHNPSGISLSGFDGPAEIAELVLQRGVVAEPKSARVHVRVIGHEIVGCNLDLHCTAIEVVTVDGPIPWAA